mmetsp:Transcript_19771/g.20055  ORF Transcript_19771/g.20055 Transcript_19771/m.20055 type:complete len:94 (+) Transcript_19771:1351-1632(+)
MLKGVLDNRTITGTKRESKESQTNFGADSQTNKRITKKSIEEKPEEFTEGTAVEGRFRGKGSRWYKGIICKKSSMAHMMYSMIVLFFPLLQIL